MKFRGLLAAVIAAIALVAVGCTNDDLGNVWGDGGTTTLTIEATLPELGGVTRAEADADDSAKGGVANINWGTHHVRIITQAYDTKDNNTPAAESVKYYTSKEDLGDGQVSLPMQLTTGKVYNIYMWVDIVGTDHEDLHYNTLNFPTVTYADGDGPAINDETYDAFFGYGQANLATYGVITWGDKPFSLQRAVSKLRIVATDSDSTATSASLNIGGTLYTGLTIGNPINYDDLSITSAEAKADVLSYGSNTADATTMITAYLLTPAEANFTIEAKLLAGSSEINTISVADIPLKRGHLTTLCGSMFSSGEAWDGQPVEPTEFEGEWMIINTAGELLWLATTSSPTIGSTTYSKFRLGSDINLSNSAGTVIQSLKVGDGATFDGNGKTLKGFLPATSALFGSVKGLTAYNLTIEGYNVTATGHVGVLVNELTATSTFTNITIKNSSATTSNGAAGGMVGYIGGGASLNLDVKLINCDLINVQASGSSAEGKFVGLLYGYDNGETLSFDANCSVDANCTVADYISPYTESNDAQWLDDTDKTPFDFTQYNGWLGDEEKYRGIVKFADNRMQIKWDGTTEIDPLKDASGAILIYSPFDLAYLGGRTLTTIRFKSDIDMGGVCDNCKNGGGDATIANDNLCSCPDCKKFSPIVYLNNLYGENHTLYNLFTQAIHSEGSLYGAGLIRRTGAGTFENFTFDGAVVKCIDDITLRNDNQLGGNAYCGTLTSCATGKITLNNVHAKNGHVIGISKLGGMIGVVRAGIDATNCSVTYYTIENHWILVENYYEKSVSISGIGTFSVSATFYTEGEAGGFIGFMNNAASTITNCHTSYVTMKCYGQDNQTKTISGKLWGFIPISYPYNIAGRHVNHFIGDIRTTNGEAYVINGCTATNNTYADGYRKDINSNGKGEIIGCCYIVGVAGVVGDTKGSVTVDGENMGFVGD